MKLLESLMNASNDAIFIADTDGNIIFANNSACNLLGYIKTEIEGIHQTKLHPPEDFDFISKKFKEFISTSDSKEIETRVIHKERYYIPVKITSANLFVDGNTTYIASYFRDMRIYKNMEHIAYLQSHVIRRPLANILGLCNLLKEGIIDDKKELEFVINSICQQAEELDVVVRKIVSKTKKI